jgi:hypothetical protein
VIPCPPFWQRVERFPIEDIREVCGPGQDLGSGWCGILCISLRETLRDSASSANLFNWSEHGVENTVAFLELVLIVIIIVRVRGQVWKVVAIGQIILIVSIMRTSLVSELISGSCFWSQE